MQRTTPIVLNLIIINVLAYMAQRLFTTFDVTEWGALHYYTSTLFKPHQFFTSMFLHDTNGFSHLLFNMFALWMFGSFMENYLGGPTSIRQTPTSTAEIISMLQKSEKNDNEAGTTWAYTVGFHLWEWLIANYGFEAYWDIAKGISGTQNYDATVLKVIGKTKSDLYNEAAPYILKSFQEALRNR